MTRIEPETARGPIGRIWWDFSGRPGPLIALLFMVAMTLVAALAPLLSQDQPYWITENGETDFPLLRGLGPQDIAWLGGLIVVAAAWCCARLARVWSLPRAKGRRLVLCVSILGALVVAAFAWGHDGFHEKRRYRAELALREVLASADAAALASGLGSDNHLRVARASYIDVGERIAEAIVLSDEIEARIAAIGATGPGLTVELERLQEANTVVLASLREAPYPPNPHAPRRPGFQGLTRPGDDSDHALGTDAHGRDLLAGLIHGTRTAMTIALLSTALCALIGGLLGAGAGYFGGALDRVISCIIVTTTCLPALFILVAAVAYLPVSWRASPLSLILFLGLTLWPHAARLVRAEVMRVAAEDFVLAARALGASRPRIIFVHLLPNALTPIIVSSALTAGSIILIESSLAFLGLGIRDAASWGAILHDARDSASLGHAWHLAVFPGLAVFLSVLSFNVIGDGVRDAADPK